MSITTSTTHSPAAVVHTPSLPPLEAGDHLDQKTFHTRYEAMPHGTQAELIGGVVYMPSPAKSQHGRGQSLIVGWLLQYDLATPGTTSLDNATDILAEDSEPQPDGFLMILPEKGGNATVNDDGYVAGPPEFIAEVASSSESYDLHSKRRDYEKHGVQEYLVLALRQRWAYWFSREDDAYVDLPPGEDGIYRSKVFPGLWLDPQAVFDDKGTRLMEVLQQGLASDEHAAFVKRLATT